jgi:tRNA(fMet)-specific endonuclease VapC
MGFLLDTNIASDLLRNPQGRIAAKIDAVGADSVCTSIIVASELRYGAARRASARITGLVEGLLSRLDVLPFEAPADAVYGEVRVQLDRAGTPIGPNDLLIAAHALALGHTLVTDNVREFSRVKSLNVENWLR